MKLVFSFFSLSLLLTLFRILDVLFFYPRDHLDWLFNTFWMGFRFDSLILSFVLIVSLMIPKFKKQLFYGLWLFLCSLYFFNSLGLGLRGEHLWLQNIVNWTDLWGMGSWGHKIISFLNSIFIFVSGIKIFQVLFSEYLKSKWQLKTLYFLGLFIFARGSFGDDHLRRNHCDGRPDKMIRSFCMNPAYTFLKPRNLEFP